MGNHRAERRGTRRGPSETTHVRYAGKRVAGRSATPIIDLTPADTTVSEALTEAPPVVATPDLLDPEVFGLEAEAAVSRTSLLPVSTRPPTSATAR